MFKTLIGVLLALSLFSANAVTEHPNGDVTFTAVELEQLQGQVNSLLRQVYNEGVKDGTEAVKSNPKLCPKDV